MKVKANRNCGIFDKEYREGEAYEVSDAEGHFLVGKEGFEAVQESEQPIKKRR